MSSLGLAMVSMAAAASGYTAFAITKLDLDPVLTPLSFTAGVAIVAVFFG